MKSRRVICTAIAVPECFTVQITCSSMSCDMSTEGTRTAMSERKQQILQTAIEIIADEGYGSLSMRALADAGKVTDQPCAKQF